MSLNQPPPGLKPHALSRSFTWPALPESNGQSLSAQQRAQYNRQGWLHVPALVTGEKLSKLRTRIDAHEAGEPDSVLTMDDGYTLTYGADKLSFSRNIALKDGAVREFVLTSPLKPLIMELLGGPARLYWDQAVYKKPGEAQEFPWHQDNGYTFVVPQAYVTVWLALEDATPENGCPWIIPGLHRYGTFAHDNASYGLEISGIHPHRANALPCPAVAGDAVIFSSLTPHRTGPNMTKSVRKAYIIQYCSAQAERVDETGKRSAINCDDQTPLL